MGDTPTELAKFIVEELSKEPFKFAYNVASFGCLSHEALLRTLHSVLCDIDPNYKEETQTDSTPDIGKIVEILRILRYWPKNNVPTNILEALEIPIPETVWEIIAWLLLKKVELKQRAYLAQFLVKVPIPEEIMMDQDVANCFEQYEDQIELFKETHRELQEAKQKMEKRPVNELVKDLGKIGNDVDCLSRKVEGFKSRIGNVKQLDKYLMQAAAIRKERESQRLVNRQVEEEETKLIQLDKKMEMLHHQMNDLIDLTEDGTPEITLNRMEQDTEILKHLVEEKLPRQIERAKRAYLAMRITEDNTPLCRADLELRQQRLEDVFKETKEVQKTIDLHKKNYDCDPSLNYAREQTKNNHQIRLDLFQDLGIVKNELDTVMSVLEEKHKEQKAIYGFDEKNSGDGWLLKPEGYRNYVKTVRAKAGEYKIMRAELQTLQAEVGNLAATKFILDGELKDSENELREVEEKLGIVGLSSVQTDLENLSSEKAIVETRKFESINNMANLAKELNGLVTEKKLSLEPLMTELSEKRKKCDELSTALKETEDKASERMSPINTIITELEMQINEIKTNYEKDEQQFGKLNAEIPILNTELHRITRYSGNGPSARSTFDIIRSKVVDAERTALDMKMEIDELDDIREYEQHQQKMWSDLAQILKVKVSLLRSKRQRSASSNDTIYSDPGRNYDSWENNESGSTGSG